MPKDMMDRRKFLSFLGWDTGNYSTASVTDSSLAKQHPCGVRLLVLSVVPVLFSVSMGI